MGYLQITTKDSLFDAVEWNGIEKYLHYPLWMQELIDQGYVYSEYVGDLSNDAWFYSTANGDEAVALGDIFVVNPWGEVKRYPLLEFHEIWAVAMEEDNGLTVTPRDKTFEAFEWQGIDEYTYYPSWVQDLIDLGNLYELPSVDKYNEAWLYTSVSGPLAVALGSIFVRNREGEVKHYESFEFFEIYTIVDEETNSFI